MKYDYNVSLHRKKRFLKRAYILFVFILLLFMAGAAVIKIDNYLDKNRNDPKATTSQQTTSYFNPTTQIFRTPYFQFQTNKNWAEVPAESEPNKFVYRSQRGTLVEHDMTVYIGNAPADLQATHVLPVKLKNNKQELAAGSVSDHCKIAAGATVPQKMVQFKGVSFLCDVDTNQYNVFAGVAGGTPQLSMKRPDGKVQTYTIFYRNVTAKPESAQFIEIINSFQTR